MTQPTEHASRSRPNRQLQKRLPLAFAAQIPLYVVIAWLLGTSDASPGSTESHRANIVVFALVAFVGLTSALASMGLRAFLTLRAKGSRAARHMSALIIALAFAEIPTLLGLVYFVLYRDWSGFALMQAAGLIAFIIHALWQPSRASLGHPARVSMT